MTRTALLAITLLSSLATPFMVQAMTPAREAAPTAPAVATAAPATKATIVNVVAAEPAKAAEPACARKVKIVYAGYGEGAARVCPAETAAK